MLGGAVAALFFVYLLEPTMKRPSEKCNCENDASIKKAKNKN